METRFRADLRCSGATSVNACLKALAIAAAVQIPDFWQLGV